jgi:hypothetical protein
MQFGLKKNKSYDLNAFGNETIELQNVANVQGRKTNTKVKNLRKEDLNAACKDKSTTIKFLKINYITD